MPRITPNAAEIEDARERVQINPLYWFARLILARERGDRPVETAARHALNQLGWTVIFSPGPGQPPPRQPASPRLRNFSADERA